MWVKCVVCHLILWLEFAACHNNVFIMCVSSCQSKSGVHRLSYKAERVVCVCVSVRCRFPVSRIISADSYLCLHHWPCCSTAVRDWRWKYRTGNDELNSRAEKDRTKWIAIVLIRWFTPVLSFIDSCYLVCHFLVVHFFLKNCNFQQKPMLISTLTVLYLTESFRLSDFQQYGLKCV